MNRLRTYRGIAWVTLAAGLTHLGACAGKPVRPEVPTRHEGALNPPVVISGSPKRDLSAFLESEEELSEADWAVLEKFGPKPIWQQLDEKRRHRSRRTLGEGARDRETVAPQSKSVERGTAKPESGSEVVSIDDGFAPLTASATIVPAAPATPSTQPTSTQPSTQPATQPAPQAVIEPSIEPIVDESLLPAQVIELPDNKLRIVWVLRNYGGTSVTTSRDGGTSRRTVAVQPPDLAPLVAVVTQNVGAGGTVTPLPKENTLVITCDRAQRANLLDLLATLDVAPRQVEITAKIFEVTHDFDFQQGAELVLNRLAADGSQAAISTFSAKRFADSVGGAAPVQGSVLKLMQTFSDAGVSIDFSFQVLAEAGLIKVVSSPRMTVAVGQTGYMLAGQELPIQSANFVNNVLQTATTYKPVGVQLYITPQAAGAEQVKLHTISIVSSVSGFAPLPTLDGNGAPKVLINPIIDSREAETAVTVNNGDTLVISGLRMIRTTTRENKIPGLGDLPILGWMFKNHRSQQQLTDLYFFVTPVML